MARNEHPAAAAVQAREEVKNQQVAEFYERRRTFVLPRLRPKRPCSRWCAEPRRQGGRRLRMGGGRPGSPDAG
jgi:hypothetical protein